MKTTFADRVNYERIDYLVNKYVSQVSVDLDTYNLLSGREQKIEKFIDHITRQLVYRLIDAHYEREIKDHSVEWPHGWWSSWKHEHPRIADFFRFSAPRYCRVTFRVFDVLKDIPVRGPRHSLAVVQEIDFFSGEGR